MNYVPQSRIAAFFDVDRTLIPSPSLEYRFFLALRQAGMIPLRNYLAWLAHAAQLIPHGLAAIHHSNKMYLRGLSFGSTSTPANKSWEPAPPQIFPCGLQQIAWHAQRGHAIFLMTGTLEPLASEVAQAIAMVLALRGLIASVGLCATRLREEEGRCTGEIDGESVFSVAKARALLRIAAELDLHLPGCYAYADHFSDRAMLEMVGHPAAVNPSPRLRRLARKRTWPILFWPSSKSLSSAPPRPAFQARTLLSVDQTISSGNFQ